MTLAKTCRALLLLCVLLPNLAVASGWNDFTLDIGHGFKVSKSNSFQVCLSHASQGFEMICPDLDVGDHGPVVGYLFTDTHLLVRTLGAKPSGDSSGHFTIDADREYFFILDKKAHYPHTYQPLGPLGRAEFVSHPAVPLDVDWERPINPNAGALLLFFVFAAALAALYFGWPLLLVVLIVLVVRAVRRRHRASTAALTGKS